MKQIVIVGAGGFGRETLALVNDLNKIKAEWEVLGFIDDNKELHGKKLNGTTILGGMEWLKQHDNSDLVCVCAVGDCETRMQVVNKLKQLGVQFQTLVHPSVIVSDYVILGEDVIVCAGVILTVNITIGSHTHINLNCTIGHDAIIENFCTLNPGVSISGNDHVHEGVYIGTGATLIQGINIGRSTTIGAGSVVIDDVPDNVVVAGVPAKTIRNKLDYK